MSDDDVPPEGGERRRRRRRRRPQEGGLGPRASGLGPEGESEPAAQEGAPPQQRPPQPPRQPQQQRPPQPQRGQQQQRPPQQQRGPQQQRPQRDWPRRDPDRAEARGPRPEAREARGPRTDAPPHTTAEIAALDPSIELDTTSIFDRRAEARATAEQAIAAPDDDTSDNASTTRAAWGHDDDGPPKDVALAADLPDDAPPGDLDPLTWEPEPAAAADAADFTVEIANAVGVRPASGGRVHVCDAGDASYDAGDHVMVDTERGPRLGTVAWASTRRPARGNPKDVRRVLRRATDGDRRADAETGAAAQGALRIAKDKAKQLGLPIKVFRVERQGGRVNLYFTSDERVDVRELVREVGAATGARIELRQLGVRDEAKMVGGIGSCGQELCCTTWLPEFAPVSIRMAKDQGLVLNPTKVSGQCGRLKCCLVYEQATYAEMRKGLPKLGKRVITPTGEGRVVEVDVLRQRIRVATGPGESTVYAAGDVKPMFPPQTRPGQPPDPADPAEHDDPDDSATDDPHDPHEPSE